MNDQTNNPDDRGEKPVTGDRLDALLRAWHDENKAAAIESRDEILRAVERDELLGEPDRTPIEETPGHRSVLARIGGLRMLATAALLAVAVVLLALFTRGTERAAFADGGLVQVAEGGALDALDADGNTLGPCPLQRTEVKVEISGLFARTIVEQTYANPYPRTIEAVYTFPLSNRAAVDRMTMVVRGPSGEKTVEGEVKERSIARAIYEEARESGYVASLLEQERPNIFTQSVANIEPGATVKVRIATVELAQRKNGVAEYVFPMVVGPRYIPGAPKSMPTLPAGWQVREGVVLRAPAGVEVDAASAIPAARLSALLESAVPVRSASTETIDQMLAAGEGVRFTAKYANGSAERGIYFAQAGLGEINGRFFFAPLAPEQGTGFAGDTSIVPDASRITPMPVRPSERAGHDVGVRVTIDSGGPAITDVASELHAVSVEAKGATTRTITLDDRKTIPNRDFILRWKVADAAIEPSFFAHKGAAADPVAAGGYFMITLEPPARVAPTEVRPRELVFVLDTSGSMNGFPIEKSKALAQRAIDAMRPNDTFNFITFAGATSVLWPEPRVANDENRRIASEFVANAQSGGGTEMMTAINAALVQEGRSGIAPKRLLDLPADGRSVRVAVEAGAFVETDGRRTLAAGDGRSIAVDLRVALPANPKKFAMLADGTWETANGERVLVVRNARFEDADARTRFVFFLTDGYIGNDQGVIAAVRDNARASRVFSFGIGNSVNRFLLDEMARAGRGVCEVVTLAESADAAIDRLVRRIESPVLTDITVEVSGALGVRDMLPGGEHLPDLFDQEPIVLLGRFERAASGVITVRGRTGAGAWEKSIPVTLPEAEPRHDVVKTLWARAKVDDILLPRMAEVESQSLDMPTKRAVVALGEAFSIATPYTSFVAVEKSRVTVGGKPMLVSVPVELPDGTSWDGFFGEGMKPSQIVASELGRSARWSDAKGLDQMDLYFADLSREQRERAAGSPPRRGIDATPAPVEEPLPMAGAVANAAPDAKQEEKAQAEGLRSGGASVSFAAAPVAPPPSAMSPGSEAPAKGKVAKDNVRRAAERSLARDARESPRQSGRSESLSRSSGGFERGTSTGLSGGFGVFGGGGGGGGGIGGSFDAAHVHRDSQLGFGAKPGEADGSGQDSEDAAKASGEPSATGADGESDAQHAALAPPDLDRLARILDRRLAIVALAVLVDERSVTELVSAFALPRAGDELEVIILVGALDDAARRELRTIGASIVAEVDGRNAVVARLRPASLVALSMASCVRRVEPARVRAAVDG